MKYLLTALLVIGIFFTTVHGQNADIDLLRKINVNRNKSLDPTFKFVSNSVLPLTLAVPASSVIYALIKKDSASRSQAIIFASSVVVSGIITYSLKYAVGRKRPYDTYSFIDNVTTEHDPSFPSGHTSWAFALATSASINYPKWYVIVPSFLYAGAVGYSRLHLGVHYPSDVFMGALVGSGSAYLSYKLNHWLFENKHNKRKVANVKL
ncbi:MAG: phosphatase PAP2 family protein [Bacteroidota bacterium]